MKVIFLDVDGVLNGSGTRERTPSGYCFVDKEKVELLQEIVKQTKAKIVLSSTWRNGWYDVERGDVNSKDAQDFMLLMKVLNKYKLDVIGKTPKTREGYRGKEIQLWLKSWGGEIIDSFIILDDDEDMEPFMEKFVQTSFDIGLTVTDVKKSIHLLMNEKN